MGLTINLNERNNMKEDDSGTFWSEVARPALPWVILFIVCMLLVLLNMEAIDKL